MKSITRNSLFLLLSLLLNGGCHAIPLVEFTVMPGSNQYVKPQNTFLLFYSIRNNTNTQFPLSFAFSSPNAHLANLGNSCGSAIPGKSSCSFVVEYQAGASNLIEDLLVQINYQGRNPLTQSIHVQVNSNIACSLLPLEAYQTSFCQQQFQNIIQFSPNVFNPLNQNVVEEQTPGGVFGVYQKLNGVEQICYVSCGLKDLNGAAPDELTMFELASVTKTFTTSILGKLQHKSTINVTDPISNSAIPSGLSLNVNEASVSYQQLATFSGGVCFSDAPGANQHPPIDQATNQADFITAMNNVNPDPASGLCSDGKPNTTPVYTSPPYIPSHNVYSNSSVGLLGQALMSIDNYTDHLEPEFNRWMCQNIINVIDMQRTSACLPAEAGNGSCASQPNVSSDCSFTANWTSSVYASGYHVSQSAFQLGDPFPYLPWAPAGGIRSNAVDMIKYVRANLGIAVSNTQAEQDLIAGMQIAHQGNNYVPSPNGVPEIINIGSQSPLRGPQGYAWVCQNSSLNGDLICGKIGGHTNFRSFIGLNKSKTYGLIILFNSGAADVDGSLVPLLIPPTPADIGVNMLEHI